VLEHAGHLFREHRARAAVHPKRELGGVGGTAELVGDVTQALRGGVREVKGLAVEALSMTNRVESPRHEVDRDDVYLPALQSYQRHP
jgi:hypothetical protein